ncbi:MAG: acyl-[acyl carrier protein]--UDP-N-acetylglucosamine O-acyltransferase [Myxococcota bacterium]|jgi:acyl-[acyl carrier protein]--UDP-N-acetylglucosamine O-acyltransferase
MVRSSFLIWMTAGSVAFAADGNEDGCQDEFASNGACVSVDATVDGTSTVGANASVFEGASVGPEVALGSGVVVAARASLAGRVAHSSNPHLLEPTPSLAAVHSWVQTMCLGMTSPLAVPLSQVHA